MSDFREEEKLGKAYDSHLARRLMRYMKPYKGQVWLALLLTLVVTPLAALPPALFWVALDRYIVPVFKKTLPFATGMRGLGWITLINLAALLFGFAIQYLQVRVMQNVGQKTMYDLRKEIFARLQALPMSFYDKSPVGRLVTRVTTDVDALNDLFASGIVAMINDAFLLVSFVGILFYMNWRLAIATLSVLPLILLATWMFRNKARDANRRIRTSLARINAFLNENIGGMAVVQLFGREKKARSEFSNLNRNYMEAYKDVIFAYALFFPVVAFLSTLAIAFVFWFGGSQALLGAVQIGMIVAFMQYAQQFFRPIQDLSDKFNILQSAMAASERIFKLLDEPIPASASAGTRFMEKPLGEIEFRNVWFAYHGGENPKEEEWILRDVSFVVPPGQTAAIVGHTGAGKTTVVQLLLRFYDIQRGQILLDGVDIREFDVQHLRKQFGIVLQDPFLFTGTLESNVKLGTEGITRAQVESALREVGLGPLLQSLSRGVETEITERGATLSVGQRQLVSFARALAHNPRFLILDEATSSVDTKTEEMIREALDRLLHGRTAVVIAHRLSTIQHAASILVFHKGKLREKGSHQELLAERGIYYRLYQLQYKDQELRAGIPPEIAGAATAETLPAND
ncbi:MAG TPA: ABC transporter ATP-binding protein [Candidatus Acidoferrales bacterium]|jgi:ATP-binding cassette, subfamily B, multidrug efflux pump